MNNNLQNGYIEPRGHLVRIEIERVIRCVRKERDQVIESKLLLQERELTVGDGDRMLVNESILACHNDIFILTSCIAKLWNMLDARPKSPPDNALPR